MSDKAKVNLCLTPSLLKTCAKLTQKLGIGKSAIMELAIRDFAEKHGVLPDPKVESAAQQAV
jgi:hypothetical protein